MLALVSVFLSPCLMFLPVFSIRNFEHYLVNSPANVTYSYRLFSESSLGSYSYLDFQLVDPIM
jgi:hypothetical protein